MRRQYLKRGMALMLSLLVFALFPLAFTEQADAASKTKNFWVVTQSNTTYQSGSSTPEKGYTKYTYDKNGLLKQVYTEGIVTSGNKAVATRNKAGKVTSVKLYDKNGNLTGITVNTIKSGRVTVSKVYTYSSGKKTLYSTEKYTYNKKGLATKAVFTAADGSDTHTTAFTYYSNGAVKKEVYKYSDGTYTYYYDKSGQMTKATSSYKSESFSLTSETNYTYTVKKGTKSKPLKSVMKSVTKYSDGSTSSSTETTTYTYDKKSGKPSKVVNSIKAVSSDYSYSSKNTTTYKYKKVKVAKKYWKLVDSSF